MDSKPLQLTCPECAHKYAWNVSLAGGVFPCQQCQTKLRWPYVANAKIRKYETDPTPVEAQETYALAETPAERERRQRRSASPIDIPTDDFYEFNEPERATFHSAIELRVFRLDSLGLPARAQLGSVAYAFRHESVSILTGIISVFIAVFFGLLGTFGAAAVFHSVLGMQTEGNPPVLVAMLAIGFGAGTLARLAFLALFEGTSTRRAKLPEVIEIRSSLLCVFVVFALAIPTLGLSVLLWFLLTRTSARRIDESGITFGDGLEQPWNALRRLTVTTGEKMGHVAVRFQFQFKQRKYTFNSGFHSRDSTLRLLEILSPLCGREFDFPEPEGPLMSSFRKFFGIH